MSNKALFILFGPAIIFMWALVIMGILEMTNFCK